MRCFKIESIEYGWFECRIGKYRIDASDYLGYDISKEFLMKLLKLLKGSSKEWIYEMNEPGASMIELSLTEDTITVSVYRMNKTSSDLSKETEDEIQNCEECKYSISIDKSELVDAIVTEYSLYETGNGRRYYEINWGDFPQIEYNELKCIAFEINKNRNELNALQCTTFLEFDGGNEFHGI